MAGPERLLIAALAVCGALSAQTVSPSKYDPVLFQSRIPADQLASLSSFAGRPANDLLRDKEFRKVLKSVVPDCNFHYGWDTPLSSALDLVLKNSSQPVAIRDGRYLTVAGSKGPYLGGRGFVWIDLQDGIALGGFFFHPTNGEPTPSVTVFSRQVREESVSLRQFPPEFAQDLTQWSIDSRIPTLTVRYFISALNKKGLLEHDEEFCSPQLPAEACQRLAANAVNLDLDAAYYLDQTHHATNATAWTADGQDQADWLRVRTSTCSGRPDLLGCQIAITRERVHVVLARNSGLHSIRR